MSSFPRLCVSVLDRWLSRVRCYVCGHHPRAGTSPSPIERIRGNENILGSVVGEAGGLGRAIPKGETPSNCVQGRTEPGAPPARALSLRKAHSARLPKASGLVWTTSTFIGLW